MSVEVLLSRLLGGVRPAAILAAACSLAIGSPIPAAGPAATRAAIGVRNAHAMTYDAVGRRIVLFGGADASSVLGETWAWTGDRRQWTLVTGDGPGPRTFPAMAFDDARGEITLFGGNRVLFGSPSEWDTLLGDTWILRGREWRRREVPGPAPRAEAALAYDQRRRRAVLFGGYVRTPKGLTRLGDTWEWDGQRWEQVASQGPSPRNGGALSYDERAGAVVLSGGPPAIVTAETWEWNGRSWRATPPPHPAARFNPAMTYDRRLGALLRFGGWTGEARAADTWVRAGGEWRALSMSGPAPRNHSSLAYDSRRGRAVLFGGHDGDRVFGDTWEFDGSTWRQVGYTRAQVRIDNNH